MSWKYVLDDLGSKFVGSPWAKSGPMKRVYADSRKVLIGNCFNKRNAIRRLQRAAANTKSMGLLNATVAAQIEAKINSIKADLLLRQMDLRDLRRSFYRGRPSTKPPRE